VNRKERRAAQKGGAGAFAPRPAEAASLYAAALAHHRAGDLAAARGLYAKVLALEPDRAECHYHLGLASAALGRVSDAVTHYARAVALKPDYAVAHANLGNALLDQGRLVEAEQCYERALALTPNVAALHYNLANALVQQGRVDAGIAQFQRSLALDPNLSLAHNNLANALMAKGRFDEAMVHCRRALALEPRFPEACTNLGNMLVFQGKHDEALPLFRRAVELKPDYAEAHNNLGVVLSFRGEWEQAAACYQRACALKPDFIDAYNNIARLALATGNPAHALAVLRRALGIRETYDTKVLIVQCLEQARAVPDLANLRDVVVRALSEPWGRPSDLVKAATLIIKANDALRAGIAQANAAWPPRLAARDLGDALAGAANDPLLRCALESAPVCDPELERLLIAHRFAMLEAASGDSAAAPASETVLAFQVALARQCFVNEYVFAVTDAEQDRVRRLQDVLAAAVASGDHVPVPSLVAVAAYRPLHALPGADGLLERQWPAPVKALLVQQVQEPRAEQRLRASIPTLTPIDDGVSRAVRDQYEDNPYPRWIRAPSVARMASLEDYLRRKFPLAPLCNVPKGGLDILIAGCGTGQTALETAERFPDAKMLAVDLSLTSLSYARRQSDARGMRGIDYAQADILQLGSLGRSFDMIETSGVLHHLADPMQGWRTLLSLLRPFGLMRLGLYSKVARQDISAARTAIAQRGYRPSPDDIRRCRQELMSFDGGQLFANISASVDFYTLSSCRDLLFHVQEHQLTLPEIAGFLAENELEFLGFELDAPVLRQYGVMHPDDPSARDLARWDAFERAYPQVFSGMYQFWVQKRA
jgi:tetratricopeptide (TPR) repeat protein/2-polyprenyl-3-methyl-5-hydroxy-6-metoxy-1,4-benzoquinol methylase